jgi:hypothetical protein
MKEKQQVLKIFPLSTPLVLTEVFAMLGDKFNSALPFGWELTRDLASAHIVVWDGVVTLKNQYLVNFVIGQIRSGKVLLFTNCSETFLKDSLTAEVISLEGIPLVELRGWNVLPEDILSAIESCHKKLAYV